MDIYLLKWMGDQKHKNRVFGHPVKAFFKQKNTLRACKAFVLLRLGSNQRPSD
jgi:hypothetical protein